MEEEKVKEMVKEDLKHVAAMLARTVEHCDGVVELNICLQSCRQILSHDAALLAQVMQP